jgi:type I restriction-modification system DNA methylase subunit
MNKPQQFLKELDKKLWTAADKLRSNLDAAVYKHAVLGLIFLKYVSDAFDIRQQEVESLRRDKTDDYYLDPADYDGDEDTAKIVSTFHAWKRTSSPRPLGGEGQGRGEVGYHDIPGFCKSATLDQIAEHGYVLTPGRYVGAEEVEDDGVPFADKMATLTTELADQFAESAKLEKAIRKNMKSLGFELPVGGKK